MKYLLVGLIIEDPGTAPTRPAVPTVFKPKTPEIGKELRGLFTSAESLTGPPKLLLFKGFNSTSAYTPYPEKD